MKLFEFQSAKSVEPWFSQDDTVMGGLSTSRLRFIEPGKVQFEGNVSLENKGGFAQIKYQKTGFDLSSFSGLELSLKGDSKIYQVRLTTDAAHVSYSQAFLATSEWQTVQLSFSKFVASFRGHDLPDAPPLNTSHLISIGLMLSDKQAGKFCLGLSGINAYP